MAIKTTLQRSVTQQGSWTTITTEGDFPGTIIDDAATPGVTYDYRAKLVDGENESGWSSVVTIKTIEEVTAPEAPANLVANAFSSSQINLSWAAPNSGGSPITGYKIERKTLSGSWSVLVNNTGNTSTSYQDSGLPSSTTYEYRVSAINAIGTSSPSSTATATTHIADTVPSAPTGLAATALSHKSIIIEWITPGSGGSPITGYRIECKVGSGSWSVLVANTGNTNTSYLHDDLEIETTYTYRVNAINAIGTGAYSSEAFATTTPMSALLREYDFTYPSPIQDVPLGAAYVYLPEEYRNNVVEDFPVIVYCHGQGERAGGTTPNFNTLANGAGWTKYLRGTSNEVPCIVICPQVVGWQSFALEGMIDECVAAVISGLGLPLKHKFVLSGYSSGGNDTWPYVRNTSNTNVVGFIPFACRLGIPSGNAQVQAYLDRNIPTWIFHNIDDPSQQSANHIGFLNTVKSIDPDNDFIRGTIYQGGGHDPVTRTINGSGGAVVAGWHPYLDAGTALYDWVTDVYDGVQPDPGPEPDPEEGLQREYDFTYTSEIQGVTGAAYVYIPQSYRDNPVSDFPVMVYCHGQGQRAGGTSPNFNALVSDDGYARWLRGTTNELPYIVISPQVVGWQSFALAGMIDEAFDKVRAELLPDLNPNKYVLSGWSAGGNDTWPFVRNTSTRVVGFVSFGCRLNIPISNTDVQAYINREIPTWVFHNNDDEIQDVSNHKAFLAEVNNIDPDIEYIRGTIYDAGGHPVVEKTISGLGDDIVSGYYPYKNAGDELAEWIENAYFGTMQPSKFINIGCTTQFRESIEVEGWNKFALFLPTDPAKELLDSEGLSTGYTMKITAPFTSDANSNISTGDDSGPVPDEIIAAFWYRSNGIATIEFVLDKDKKYKFTFYGGRDGSADDKSADFTIGAETVSLNGLHNLTNTVSINNVVPDNDNIVVLSVKNTTGYIHAILNAIMIEEY